MGISTALNEAMKNMLISMGIDCVEVTSYDESSNSGSCGYGTCWYEDWEVTIYYTNSKDENKWYDYQGKFGSLIAELDKHS